MRSEQVYVMGYSPNGPLKIGCANVPRRRLSTLRAASPRTLKLYAWGTPYEDDAGDKQIAGDVMERVLHARFSDRRRSREWFNLTLDEVFWWTSEPFFTDELGWSYIEWEWSEEADSYLFLDGSDDLREFSEELAVF